MEKSIAIIGAGIAGLSAGCYARMNGYETTIFELHDKPGGLCTSWKREGYTIDGCLHWLVGSSSNNNMYKYWEELGAAKDWQIVDHEEFMRLRDSHGKDFIVYTDIDRLEKHMIDLSPKDEKTIKEFTSATRKMTRFDFPPGKPREIAGWMDKAKTMTSLAPFMLLMTKWGRTSVSDFANRFKDPFLSKAFRTFFDLPDFPMAYLMITLAWMHKRTAGYPIGGSLEFAKAIEKRYFNLGGEIRYKSRVSKILVENNKAVGLRLDDGSEHRADVIISAADGHATIFEMLDGKYIDDEIRGYYDNMPRFKSLVYVGVGVNRDMSSEPHHVTYMLDEPIAIGGETHSAFSVKHYNYDPTMAPAGKSIIVSMFMSEHAWWKGLYKERERYKEEKKKISDTVIGFLESKYPGISDQVEMVDVATPITFERYTSNWEGSMEGWLITRKNALIQMKRTLPGLDNFYMVGQWVQPGGGVPTGAIHGHEIVHVICHRDGKPFVTSTP